MAKWVYQMTPHDQWDYDGVNESLLVNLTIEGKIVPALVHFDRKAYCFTVHPPPSARISETDPCIWRVNICTSAVCAASACTCATATLR